MKMRRLKRRVHRSLVISVILLAMTILSGCSNKTPGMSETVLDPQEVLTKVLSGDLFTRYPHQAISPGGDYLLAEVGDSMLAVSLKEDDTEDLVLHTISGQDSSGYVRMVPVGWTSPTTCVFLIAGAQAQGGKYGVAVMQGDVTNPGAEEVGFIEIESGVYHSFTFIEEESRVYVHVSKALWECDLKTRSLRLVKSDLPTYDGLFAVRVSPAGRYAVYQLWEEDKKGIYVMDIATGEERPLLPVGETRSFLPQWSPDGEYILAYTAGQKPNAEELEIWERYEVFQGEDSLMPIAGSLTVVTPEGEVVKTVSVEGKLLAHARWAQNSETIGFLAGIPRVSDGSGGSYFQPEAWRSAVQYDSAMLVDVSRDGEPVRVADLKSLPGYEDPSVDLVLVDPSGKGLYFVASNLVDYSLEDSKLWYAPRDGEPVEICDGRWQYGGIEPVYGDHVAGVLFADEKQSVWLVGPEDSRMLYSSGDERSWTGLLGYDDSLLVVGTWQYHPDNTATTTVTVYRMYRVR